LPSDDPAIGERVKLGDLAFDRNAAGNPGTGHTANSHDLISASINDLGRVDLIVAESGPKALGPFTNPFVTNIWPDFGRGGVIDPNDVRIERAAPDAFGRVYLGVGPLLMREPGPPLCPVLLLATSHDQRRENGLIEDEEDQQYEPRNDSPRKHEYHACGQKERPEEGIEAHAKR
jgi:hypothetical protein